MSNGVEAKSLHCCGEDCKKPEFKFSFCKEHFDHFKFGLIKKDGKKVSDYEKKFSHYQNFLKKKQHKAA